MLAVAKRFIQEFLFFLNFTGRSSLGKTDDWQGRVFLLSEIKVVEIKLTEKN